MSIKVRRKPQKDSIRKRHRKIKQYIAVRESEMITVSVCLALRHEGFEWLRNERGKEIYGKDLTVLE